MDKERLKMKKAIEIADARTLRWLLEEENPSVRFFTLTQLLKKPLSDEEVKEAKKNIMKRGLVPAILGQQNAGGYWGSPERFYTDKYTGTVWQMMILAELGADGKNGQIGKTARFILENSQDPENNGFSYRRSERSGGGLASGVVPCLTGNMVWSLVTLGFIDDERVWKGVEWICKYQRCDDGTENPPSGPPYDRYDMCWGRHSCHMGVVKSLKALAAVPEEKRDRKIREKTAELAEYILLHRIHKKSHDTDKVARPGWLKPGFPLMYQTDILEILEIMTGLGFTDPRMEEAAGILLSKQNMEKRWKLENSFNGKMIERIEKKGSNSKWITLKALKVLSAYYKLDTTTV